MNDTKERPIVLTAQEVNAVLAGDKTQHRVIIKMPYGAPEFRGCRDSDQGDATLWGWDGFEDGDVRVLSEIKCPFGKVGDRLWVQEFHARTDRNDHLTRPHYYADGTLRPDLRHDAGLLIKYSAADMPRWASRLLLEITDIRIERVQDISESDALASGLIVQKCQQGSQWFLNPTSNMRSNVFHRDEWIGGFASYWDSLNGKLSFNDNPWVWVIEFKVIKESNDG